MTLEAIVPHSDRVDQKELKRVGKVLSSVLSSARVEDRVTCGLVPAIHQLEVDADRVLLCILPQPVRQDSARHIQTVLLEAFCYERNIAIVKVDNAERLKELVKGSHDCSCVLVHEGERGSPSPEQHLLHRICKLAANRGAHQPVFKLPAK